MGFIALNPSTADAAHPDPTLRRCIGFAQRAGAGSLVVVNLYGLRATHPRDLWAAECRVGPGTDRVLRAEVRACAMLVACWGVLPLHALPRARQVVRWLDSAPGPLVHLGLSKAGHPRHPLYLRKDAPFQSWDRLARQDGPYAA